MQSFLNVDQNSTAPEQDMRVPDDTSSKCNRGSDQIRSVQWALKQLTEHVGLLKEVGFQSTRKQSTTDGGW